MELKKIITECVNAMKKAVDHTSHEFSTLHTGKSSPSMVDNIQVYVESYKTTQRLKDLASVTTPDARSIVVQPFDIAVIEDIRKAIQAANIGINPVRQDSFLRCPVPPLSKERRLELAKKAAQMAEEGKVRIRNVRREALELLKKSNKNKLITNDELKRSEKEVQLHTNQYINEIESKLTSKETELKSLNS